VSAVLPVNAVDGLTVVEEVDACIALIKEKVAGDTRGKFEVTTKLPAGKAFWLKFASSSFNRSYALTESSRLTGQNVATEAETQEVDEMQNRLTSIVEEVRLRRLLSTGTAEEVVRLANCCWEGASLYNVVMPLEDRLVLRDWEYRSATRHQYGMVPIIGADRVWTCSCGREVTAGHNHRCNRVSGPATLHRHQCVVQALRDVARQECGLLAEETPRVWSEVKDRDENGYVIPDLIFTGGDMRLAVDVSGVFGEAASYMRGDLSDRLSLTSLRRTSAVVSREKDKIRHYAELPASGEMDFLPFVFESHGALGECARRVIEHLSRYGAAQNGCSESVMAGYIKRVVAIAIQRGNAGLDSMARGRQAGSYGAAVGRGMIGGRLHD
jgi:hypothetical protein